MHSSIEISLFVNCHLNYYNFILEYYWHPFRKNNIFLSLHRNICAFNSRNIIMVTVRYWNKKFSSIK
jgi:hypothetical protein